MWTAFYKQLISALSYSGFVKIVNHGIGEDLIQEAFGWVNATDEQTHAVDKSPIGTCRLAKFSPYPSMSG